MFWYKKKTTRLSPSSNSLHQQHTNEQYLTNDLFCSLSVNIERKHVETVDLYFQQMTRELVFTCLNSGCFSVEIEDVSLKNISFLV
jgi:hypothetical protein